MRITARCHITAVKAVTILLGALFLPLTVAAEDAKPASAFQAGKAIAFDNKKGNCLACHYIEGGELPGNIGPALAAIKSRYDSKDKLRAQIFDARKNNPNTIMPPFGAHEILSEDELEKVVEFIYSL